MNLDNRLIEGIELIKKNKFYVIGILILMVAIFILTINQMDRYWEKKTKDYVKLETKDQLSGTINNIFDSQGISYIMINDSSKYLLIHSRNYLYEPSWLDAFLQKGDSIVKYPESDSLFVFRENIKYLFILGKYLNEQDGKQ